MAGFFSNKAYGHEPRPRAAEYSFINIGNEQFHAVAVAFIDSLQSDSQRGNDAILKKILERFYQYFPKYISSQPYLTLTERMGILLTNSRKSELVECMAYVLRQLTVDELYTHPLMYREIFHGLSGETPKSYLRDPEIKLPSSALNALAHALGITVTLSFKELGKELRKREIYEGVMANINLVIQVQGDDQYFPGVKRKADFAYVGQLAITAPKPVENTKEEGETLSDIINLIVEDNKELLQSYNEWRTTILSAVNAGELTYKQLVKFFTTFYPSQSSSNTVSLSTLVRSEEKTVIADTPQKGEQQDIRMLVDTLSFWISTKKVSNDLAEEIESQATSQWRLAKS